MRVPILPPIPYRSSRSFIKSSRSTIRMRAGKRKKLRKFMTDFFVDTVQMQPIDKVYSIDGYGAKWRMDKCLWHLEKPTFDEPSLDLSKFPSAKKFVDPILQSKAGAIVSFNDNSEQYRLIQMGWGIFEHSWRMRGFENVLMDMLTDEDFYKELTGKLTELYLAMLKACEDVPADAYLFGDDWGDQRGVIMGAKTWRKFIKPCWEKIYAEVHRQGKLALQHSCGSISEIYDDLIEIGMDCHESVQPEPANHGRRVYKRKMGAQAFFLGRTGFSEHLVFWFSKGNQSGNLTA